MNTIVKRNTVSSINKQIRNLNLIFDQNLSADWMLGRPRLMIGNNGKYISPRMSKKECSIFLSGFVAALDSKEDEQTLAKIT